MTDIIFSFDTEDFTQPDCADMIKREAEILECADIRGGFALVGQMAKALREWECDDVIEAMKKHDIGCHSLFHSVHPTINEYTDTEDFSKGYEEFMRQESEACALVRGISGKDIVFAVPPGNQRSYTALYGYSDMNIPIYADMLGDNAEGKVFYYCNMLQLCYAFFLEDHLFAAKTDDDLQKIIDVLSRRRHAIIYTHPQMAKCLDFWDGVNYNGGNLCEFGKWKQCRRRSPEETEEFFRKFRRLIELMKADGRIRFSSYAEMYERLRQEGVRTIKRCDIPRLYDKLSESFYPTEQFCIFDIFCACVAFLRGAECFVCGKAYGFLDTPYAIDRQVTLSADNIISAAQGIDCSAFLPSEFYVGGVKIGPADLLRAMLFVLCGKNEVTLTPDVAMPSLSEFPTLNKNPLLNNWIQAKEFKDSYISKRIIYQAWTLRFPSEKFYD